MTVGGMKPQSRPLYKSTRWLAALAVVFTALLPALPVYAEANTDTGPGGQGGSNTPANSAGRGVVCRNIGSSFEGWGTLSIEDRAATSTALGLSSSTDTTRAEGTKTTINGSTWSWSKSYLKWIEYEVSGSSPGAKRTWGGPGGDVWTWAVSGVDGFQIGPPGKAWVRFWFKDYPNCDPVLCPGGTCSASLNRVPKWRWCLPNDEASVSEVYRIPPSSSLKQCERADATSDPLRKCQMYWEVWRFYGKSRDTDPTSFYTVSRVPLLKAPACPTATESRIVSISPHPADGPSANDPRATPTSGRSLFDGGFARFNDPLVSPPVYAPNHLQPAEGYTTSRPFDTGGTQPGADCTILQNKDATTNPYAGNSQSATLLRQIRRETYISQGYSPALADAMANQNEDQSWDDGLACSSGAEYAVAESVPVGERPVYGSCWVPVVRAGQQMVSGEGGASYVFRDSNLYRYDNTSRGQVKVVGPGDDIDKFVLFLRMRNKAVTVSSINSVPNQPPTGSATSSTYAGYTKTIYLTSSEMERNLNLAQRNTQFLGKVEELWKEAHNDPDPRFKVSLESSKVTAVDAADRTRGSGGLGHHEAWRQAIRTNVLQRWNEAWTRAPITSDKAVTSGMGIGHPIGQNHLNSNWVPAAAYTEKPEIITIVTSKGRETTTTWSLVKDVYPGNQRQTAAENAALSAICADGPMSAGDFVASNTKIKITSTADFPSGTLTSDWKVEPCVPASRASKADIEACESFNELSATEQKEKLEMPKTSAAAEDAWSEVRKDLLARKSRPTGSINLGQVGTIEYGTGSNRTIVVIEAVVVPSTSDGTVTITGTADKTGKVSTWEVESCVGGTPNPANPAAGDVCKTFDNLPDAKKRSVLEKMDDGKSAFTTAQGLLTSMLKANPSLTNPVRIGPVGLVEVVSSTNAVLGTIDIEAVVTVEGLPEGTDDASVTIYVSAYDGTISGSWTSGPCLPAGAPACDAFLPSRTAKLSSAASKATDKFATAWAAAKAAGTSLANPLKFLDVEQWSNGTDRVRIHAEIDLDTGRAPGPCPGLCFEGNLDQLRPNDRPSAIVTLVIPRTFGTGAGMFTNQNITAVIHDYVDTKDGKNLACNSPEAISTAQRGGVSGYNPATMCTTSKTPSLSMNLAVQPTGTASKVNIVNSVPQLLQCGDSGLRQSFSDNFQSNACTKKFSIDSYRASSSGGGLASTVSASGRVQVIIGENTPVRISVPTAALGCVLEQLPFYRGADGRININCRIGQNSSGSSFTNGNNSSTFPSSDPSTTLEMPAERIAGEAGIQFIVRVVFEEHKDNPNAHDTILTDAPSNCGPRPAGATNLLGSGCTLRPVISSSATSRR